ncbi:hypothetical protein [Herbaspirillum seropedicae]|uniref:hypothetical protein n=1 Tax=Herbaspirillum seropedicae TaxID=964 RepID=UPI003FCD10F3
MIKKIAIKHVKGISNLDLEVDLYPNKPALFVAPNGFGKSSITVAFKSLNRNRISLNEQHYYGNDQSNKPAVHLTYVDDNNTDITLTADENQNQISDVFDVITITSLARAKGTKRNTGKFTAVSADYVIDPIILIATIPEKKQFNYSFNTVKSEFGKIGKALPNIGFLKDEDAFLSSLALEGIIEALGKTSQIKQQEKINEILSRLNSAIHSHSATEIHSIVKNNEIDKFREIQHLKTAADHIRKFDFCGNDEVNSYFVALQLSLLFRSDTETLKKICKYAEYELEKKNLAKIFSDFNTSWQKFSPKETKRSLVLEFPKLHHISNGQRDVMAFVAELQRAKKALKNKRLLLVIDEVFDYLDEANLVATQFYISKFVEEAKERGAQIYPIIMTHLSPEFFNSYVFGSRLKLQIRYLRKFPNRISDSMKRLLKERNSATSPLKLKIEKYLLHYHPVPINDRADFAAAGLKETWGDPGIFYKHIDTEVKKYLANDSTYDPMCVCCAVRVRIEHIIYDNISDNALKKEFVDTIVNGTSAKLDFASDIGIFVPETYYLLGVVYNEGLHWRDDDSFVSKIVTRLQNSTITNMVRALFS